MGVNCVLKTEWDELGKGTKGKMISTYGVGGKSGSVGSGKESMELFNWSNDGGQGRTILKPGC